MAAYDPPQRQPRSPVGRPPSGAQRTQTATQVRRTAQVVPQQKLKKKRAAMGPQSRRTLRRLDTWTVLRVSLMFYTSLSVVFLVAGIILWNIASAFGIINSLDKLIRSQFDLTHYTLYPLAVLGYSIVLMVILALIGTFVNVLAALIYNLISDVVGGVQVLVVDEPTAPRSGRVQSS